METIQTCTYNLEQRHASQANQQVCKPVHIWRYHSRKSLHVSWTSVRSDIQADHKRLQLRGGNIATGAQKVEARSQAMNSPLVQQMSSRLCPCRRHSAGKCPRTGC